MVRTRRKRDELADYVTGYFADTAVHKSHGLGIDRDQARVQGVAVDVLEADQELQDAS